jgi:hypothetical protein
MLNEFPMQRRRVDALKALYRVGHFGKSYPTITNEQTA